MMKMIALLLELLSSFVMQKEHEMSRMRYGGGVTWRDMAWRSTSPWFHHMKLLETITNYTLRGIIFSYVRLLKPYRFEYILITAV